MKPIEAVNVLSQVTENIPLTRKNNALVLEAIQVLLELANSSAVIMDPKKDQEL